MHGRGRCASRWTSSGAACGWRSSDDGVGFDVEAMQLDPRRGIGLRNMRERIAAIGGRLDLRSGSRRDRHRRLSCRRTSLEAT